MNFDDNVAISIERRASDHIEAGLGYECAENWTAAANEYRQVFALNPSGWVARYSANNNLGYVLIQLGQYEEASNLCRAAIDINPSRYNAHKNLGLALQGRGLWKDAVLSYIEATRLNPTDARAWQLLEHLLQSRPTLTTQHPEIRQLIVDMQAELQEGNYLQPPIEPSPMFRPTDIPGEH